MISKTWLIFGTVVLLFAWISASYHKRQGYFFWRTFFLAIMGFSGLGLLFYKLFLM
ncbi:MAG: hypothetical protein H6601_05365 [Flavobacteriales bacterium]|nr:hypothetical protein [Flavobacteriales bacterium]